ncbi:MAG: aminodeoxychorismate/anthranilate synthase component II [Kiritimatiellae bacterium]|jgi:anthranilate synthase component 2|nr:aminodeoxychorismate/anthranilate synthase component II [Kiritimatiellia bacterium]
MLIMIDNYDSFTYNLVQYFYDLKQDVKVFRNDAITIENVLAMNPDYIVISPGPGRPSEAGISIDLIRTAAGKVPVLGVCLGHQSIGEAFGGKIIHAKSIMHGKTSKMSHNGEGVFCNLRPGFEATRYHSLVIERESCPECLDIVAETEDGEIMAVVHKEYPIYGIQFHPESILTRSGKRILANFLDGNASHEE